MLLGTVWLHIHETKVDYTIRLLSAWMMMKRREYYKVRRILCQ